ncbi:cardiolipin synthase [Wenzhouxiangella sp. XN79A]|uniref:phospholipase D-like domain-containing protein n=1 Tax=Wenzhouxiangella sp. XN79A TaxID=2724193 RepID=UPI00144AD60C|nr:phospholipase D-like domain-containing protein [Wenzhouxiangella sp. XN79A]NKI34946.1 cardiolipin synthase [Wenzhouxiangella sp. XN79A]
MVEPERLLDPGLVAALFHLVLAPATGVHALLFKRDARAAFGWIALCVLLPIAGPIVYLLLGVNRIRRRAAKLEWPALKVGHERGRPSRHDAVTSDRLLQPLRELATIGEKLSRHPLVFGHRVEPLVNGDEAYPRMLDDIDGAVRSVFLSSYIFDGDGVGAAFVDRLAAARERGVDVRVIVDGVGEFYGRPRIGRALQRAGIPFARFLPPRLIPPQLSLNLRNHHKILAVDGHTAYTGGMNIGARHRVSDAGRLARAADLQFRIAGPVAAQLEAEFLRTWTFCTRDESRPPALCPLEQGSGAARVITDGPDEDLDQLTLLLSSAIAAARRRIDIMTPYFLPPRELIAALQAAALRGIEVRLVLPAENNLPFVHWANRNMLWELLFHNIEVVYQAPPFAHTKLLLIDDAYVQIGSTNWDCRSLRLNFELQVELFDERLAGRLREHFETARRAGRPVTLEEVDGRSLPVRLRDACCWLFSPYL